MSTPLEDAVKRSRRLRPRTRELYLQCVTAYLDFAGRTPKEWTTPSVARWRDHMAGHLKPQTANVALHALRFASRQYAKREGARDFAANVESLVTVKKRSRKGSSGKPLSYKQAERLLAACRGARPRALRDRALIVLGLRTGMLRSSMCGLKISDLTADGDLTFTVKGGRRHTVQLDAPTYKALRAWLDWLDEDEGYIFRSLGKRSPDGSMRIGKDLTHDGLYRIVRYRSKLAKLKNVNPNTFRRTFLAWAQRKGATPAQIAAVTGLTTDGPLSNEDPSDGAPPANELLPEAIG